MPVHQLALCNYLPAEVDGGRQNIRANSKYVNWTYRLWMSYYMLHIWTAGGILIVNFGENTSSSLDFHIPI